MNRAPTLYVNVRGDKRGRRFSTAFMILRLRLPAFRLNVPALVPVDGRPGFGWFGLCQWNTGSMPKSASVHGCGGLEVRSNDGLSRRFGNSDLAPERRGS